MKPTSVAIVFTTLHIPAFRVIGAHLCEELCRLAGWRAVLITAGLAEKDRRDLEKAFPSVRIYSLERESGFARWIRVPFRVLRIIKAENVRILHYHWVGIDLLLIGLVKLFASARLVLSFQDWDNFARRYGRTPARFLVPLWARLLLRQADRVTAVSRATLQEVRRFYPAVGNKSSVVPNGVAKIFFERGPSGSGRLAPRGWGGRPYICCVGRRCLDKGPDVLLLAFFDVAQKYPDLRLVVIGRDQQRGHTAALAKRLNLSNRVLFIDNLENGEVARWVRRSLFFALASRKEPFGMAILEAMASGKAVMATDADGIPEFVTPGVTGLLAPSGRADAFSRGMRRLLEDPALRNRLGRHAKKRAMAFRWQNVARRYARTYSKMWPTRAAAEFRN